MTEMSCHQSKSPVVILMARSIIANPDRIASVSQIFRFALLLNMVFLDLVGYYIIIVRLWVLTVILMLTAVRC